MFESSHIFRSCSDLSSIPSDFLLKTQAAAQSMMWNPELLRINPKFLVLNTICKSQFQTFSPTSHCIWHNAPAMNPKPTRITRTSDSFPTFRGAARGDECSAYLTHILGSYENLADFTIFLQSDPMDHLHFDFLDLVLRTGDEKITGWLIRCASVAITSASASCYIP